ncbi:MAG: sigma 54-interacting transcriptional regulator [Polyangiaceae bacterium]
MTDDGTRTGAEETEKRTFNFSSQRRRLVVIGETGTTTFPLPTVGEVTIGRSVECDIRIIEPGISRRHATLRIGAELSVVDLGSSNGTSIGERKLVAGEVGQISSGMLLVLGSTTIMIQNAPPAARLRHIRSHDYFEARLEDECARADATEGSFSVVRLRCGGSAIRTVEEAFSQLLRPMDVVSSYAPNDYELLLVDTAPERAREVCAELEAQLAIRGARVELGMASYPRDSRTPEQLVSLAGAGFQAARATTSAMPRVSEDAMEKLKPMVERVAAGMISVLILGETGVGKEVLANSIHRLSRRAEKPLLCLNCAALSETLLESELFGHERGAFTGAVTAKAGLLESAQGGTVFLDEVGEMPAALQAKLLRVLEQREVVRVGALTPRSIDVRFIAATNRDLEIEIARGRFRQDLYFRLNGISLVIPPLRERVREIEPLATAFITHFTPQAGRAKEPRLSPEALDFLKRYAWPGNIRELRNVIERAVLLCATDVITLAHLPVQKMGRMLPERPADLFLSEPAVVEAPRQAAPSSKDKFRAAQPTLIPDEDVEPDPAQDPERERIVHALEECAGNQTHAAKLLGISLRTLVTRIEQYGLRRPRKAL